MVKNFVIHGTFRIVLLTFSQFISIRGSHFEKFTSFIYILMIEKAEVSYAIVLNEFKELIYFYLNFIITDFEKCFVNAVTFRFPMAIQKIFNCIFFKINLKKTLGSWFSNIVKTKSLFNNLIRKIFSLAYIQLKEVTRNFEKLCEELHELNTITLKIKNHI